MIISDRLACLSVVQATSDRDEDQLATPLPVGFGTVKLLIHRGTKGAPTQAPIYIDKADEHESLHELSVKKLKVTQRATLGPPVAVPNRGQVKFIYSDPADKPLSVACNSTALFAMS